MGLRRVEESALGDEAVSAGGLGAIPGLCGDGGASVT